MRCRKAEKWLLLSMDERLDANRLRRLRMHLENCPVCSGMKKEYETLRELLVREPKPEPLPGFWERLSDKLPDGNAPSLLVFWEKWCLKAVPVVAGVALAFAAAIWLFLPSARESAGSPELTVLKGHAGIFETDVSSGNGYHHEGSWELILVSMEEENGSRGTRP